jgi:hypothetical protein
VKKFAACVLLFLVSASAQSDIAPYRFAVLDSPNGYKVYVYKVVHQGCELFVAVGAEYGYAQGGASPSITTGRGCR